MDIADSCLLLISRHANLMLALNGHTALDRYGLYTRLAPSELEQRRATVLTAFEQAPRCA